MTSTMFEDTKVEEVVSSNFRDISITYQTTIGDVLVAAPTLEAQVIHAVLYTILHAVLIHIFMFYIALPLARNSVKFKETVGEIEAYKEGKWNPKAYEPLFTAFFMFAVSFSHATSAIFAMPMVFGVFDLQTNAMFARWGGLTETAFDLYHYAEDVYFNGWRRLFEKGNLMHHFLGVGMVIPMNMYYSENYWYAFMIFCLNFSGSAWGINDFLHRYRDWNEYWTFMPFGFLFAAQRIPLYVYCGYKMMAQFWTDSAWGFVLGGGLGLCSMGYFNVMTVPAQFWYSWGMLTQIGPFRYLNMRCISIWRNEKLINEIQVAIPKDAERFPFALQDGRPIVLGEEINEGLGFKKFRLKIGTEDDKPLEVIFTDKCIRLASQPNLVLECVANRLLQDLFFAPDFQGKNQFFSVNADGSINACNAGTGHQVSWMHVGFKNNKLCLVGPEVDEVVAFNTKGWPINGVLAASEEDGFHLQNDHFKMVEYSGRQFKHRGCVAKWLRGTEDESKALKFGWNNEQFTLANSHMGLECAAGKVTTGTEVLIWFVNPNKESTRWTWFEDGTFQVSRGGTTGSFLGMDKDGALKLVNKDDKGVIVVPKPVKKATKQELEK